MNSKFSKKGPGINIYLKSGFFRINSEAVNLMGINKKSRLTILQDPVIKTDWYIMASPDGFPLSYKKKEQSALYFTNLYASRQITETLFPGNKSASIDLWFSTIPVDVRKYGFDLEANHIKKSAKIFKISAYEK